jgi:hypothetical protein
MEAKKAIFLLCLHSMRLQSLIFSKYQQPEKRLIEGIKIYKKIVSGMVIFRFSYLVYFSGHPSPLHLKNSISHMGIYSSLLD